MSLVEVDATPEDRDGTVGDRPQPEGAGVPRHRRRGEARQLSVRDLDWFARTGAFPCDRDRVTETGAENDAGHRLDVRALPDRSEDPHLNAVSGRREVLLGHETRAAFSRSITTTGVGSTPFRIAR